jgi:hypothetical protein
VLWLKPVILLGRWRSGGLWLEASTGALETPISTNGGAPKISHVIPATWGSTDRGNVVQIGLGIK